MGNFAVLLTGTSSAGKTTLLKQVTKNLPGLTIISADVIFDKLKQDVLGPWSQIKPLVQPAMVKMIKKEMKKKIYHIVIDDNKTDIIDDLPKLKKVLLFCPLKHLGKHALKRKAGDRRPFKSILGDYAELFVVGTSSSRETDSGDVLGTSFAAIDTNLEKLSYNDVLTFLASDPMNKNKTDAQISAVTSKYCKKIGLPTASKNKKYPIVPREDYDLILKGSKSANLAALIAYLD